MDIIKKNKNVMYMVAVLVILAAGYLGWMQYQAMQNTPEAKAAEAEIQKNDILAKVKALTVLPDEEAVLFTVDDAALLKGQQAFFKDSENGDVLLVFQTNGKALIYRKATDKIINSGPISFQQPATTTPVKK